MRAARLRGAQIGKNDQQYKLSTQEDYNGEIKNIMNLLKPSGPGGLDYKHIAQQQQQQLERIQPQKQEDSTRKRNIVAPTISMSKNVRSSAQSSDFDEDINDEDVNETMTSSLDSAPSGELLFNFKSQLPGEPGTDSNDIIKDLKGDIISLQHALQNERTRSQGLKNVAGSQFRIGKPETRCENCTEISIHLKKSKEIIRSLKLQLSRLEDKYVGLRKSRTIGEDIPTQSNVADDRELLQKRNDEYEVEIARLRKNAKTDQYTIESLQKMLLEWQLKDENNKQLMKTQNENNERLATACEEQQKLIEKMKIDLGQYQIQLEAAELKLNRPKSNDDEKERELFILGLKQRLTDSEVERDLLLAQIAQLQRDLDDSLFKLATTENGRLAALHAERDATLARDNTIKDNVALQNANKALKDDAIKNEKVRAQLSVDLHTEKGKFVELANENVSLMQDITRLRDLIKALEDGKATTQHALEKAIAQSVRLCVVAPTVNVHVSDKKMKFKGGLQEGKLKDFLDSEILDKYSILFKQTEENSSPDGSTNIQGWLQKLLAEMQKSIEMHVNNAMSGDAS